MGRGLASARHSSGPNLSTARNDVLRISATSPATEACLSRRLDKARTYLPRDRNSRLTRNGVEWGWGATGRSAIHSISETSPASQVELVTEPQDQGIELGAGSCVHDKTLGVGLRHVGIVGAVAL
jgi:hypothetical protein